MITLRVLGGAGKVATSAALLLLGERGLLIGGGIRMGTGESGRLPDLSPLNDRRPEAVILHSI